MCRVLAYLGSPVLLDDFLFAADVSLVRQATEPRMMQLLNLGGFGLAAWDQDSPDPARPLTYRTAGVPVFDRNLDLREQARGIQRFVFVAVDPGAWLDRAV